MKEIEKQNDNGTKRRDRALKRYRRIRAKARLRLVMNYVVFPSVAIPVTIIFNVMLWVGSFIHFLRKPIAIAMAGAAGVAGVYWSEWFPSPEFLKPISYQAYILSKYVITGVCFSVAFLICSEFYKD